MNTKPEDSDKVVTFSAVNKLKIFSKCVFGLLAWIAVARLLVPKLLEGNREAQDCTIVGSIMTASLFASYFMTNSLQSDMRVSPVTGRLEKIPVSEAKMLAIGAVLYFVLVAIAILGIGCIDYLIRVVFGTGL